MRMVSLLQVLLQVNLPPSYLRMLCDPAASNALFAFRRVNEAKHLKRGNEENEPHRHHWPRASLRGADCGVGRVCKEKK